MKKQDEQYSEDITNCMDMIANASPRFCSVFAPKCENISQKKLHQELLHLKKNGW